jgi:hypothetical protein
MRIVTILRNGKIERGEAGKRAGDYLPDDEAHYDLVVKNGASARFVDKDYVLTDGDFLVVAQRGVAG